MILMILWINSTASCGTFEGSASSGLRPSQVNDVCQMLLKSLPFMNALSTASCLRKSHQSISGRQNLKLGRLDHRTNMAVFALHFHQAIARHGFEGARQVAGFAASEGSKSGDGFRLSFADDLE